jgi:hypothetical protein
MRFVSDQEFDVVPVGGKIIAPRGQFQRAVSKGFHALEMTLDACLLQRMALRGHLYPGC